MSAQLRLVLSRGARAARVRTSQLGAVPRTGKTDARCLGQLALYLQTSI